MNRFYKISTIIIELMLAYIILIKKIYIPCASKKLFGLSCPACGLTRAFKSILSLNFIDAIKYNFLSITIFIFLIILNIYLIYDILTNNKKTNFLFTKLGKHYILILIILIINAIINNIKGI